MTLGVDSFAYSRSWSGSISDGRPHVMGGVWSRWDMKDVGSGTWQIQAFATQDISKGKPLLLRYIDGFPGTHYLMHYGFA